MLITRTSEGTARSPIHCHGRQLKCSWEVRAHDAGSANDTYIDARMLLAGRDGHACEAAFCANTMLHQLTTSFKIGPQQSEFNPPCLSVSRIARAWQPCR